MKDSCKSKLKVIFSPKMIPFSVKVKMHTFLLIIGFLNFVGIYYYSAFLNKISIIFDSSADSIVAIM